MKNLVNLTGSIAKREALIPIKNIVLANTAVYEASDPYDDYYGQLPKKAIPNSLFLFTKRFFFLEEILSCSQQFEKCLLDQINIAVAIITNNAHQYPAIRIKSFPDYTRLISVQKCLSEQGIQFSSIPLISGKIEARINKLFVLEKVSDNIYIDMIEDQKGYLFFEKRMLPDEFEYITNLIKNSSNCNLFDAVQGQMLQDGQVVEFVRIFAEGLDLEFLQELNKEFLHAMHYTSLKYS
jgi:hypothetical protein